MKLLLDDNGNVVVRNGKPVYVLEDGSEVEFDAPGTSATIKRINAEAKNHRERAEKAEGDLKSFEGIEDPAAAIKALQTVSNLDQKKLVDAGEVQKVKDEAIKSVRAEFEPVVKERDTLQQQLHGEIVGGNFARSKFITEKLAIPSDLVQAKFGAAFKVEDGKMVAYDQQGQKIYAPGRPGEIANFDEALGVLVESYPHRDSILKGSGGSGGGAQGGGGGGGGGKTMSRAQFESSSPDAQMTHIKGGGTLTD